MMLTELIALLQEYLENVQERGLKDLPVYVSVWNKEKNDYEMTRLSLHSLSEKNFDERINEEEELQHLSIEVEYSDSES